MTTPSEPSVEASELSDAVKRDLRDAISHSSSACESWECVTCEALFRTVGKLLADHERAVRQAWEEGAAAERERVASELRPFVADWDDDDMTAAPITFGADEAMAWVRGRQHASGLLDEALTALARTADPEDPSALRAGGAE